MAGRSRFRGFISYSQKDKAEAKRLQRWLETWRTPGGLKLGLDRSRKLGRFFRDDEDMSAAADIGATVRSAIEEAESLIVVCSPHAAQSKWVNAEINHFRNTGRRDRVFAVIVDGVPNSHDPRTECFPPALRATVDPSNPGAMPIEPLGLDLRKEGRTRACARLAAALLNIDFDLLWRRERARARQRMLQAAAAWVLVGAAVLAAYVQRPLLQPILASYLSYRPYVHPTQNLAAGASGPGSEFQDCRRGSPDCPTMIVVSAGAFMMGGPPDATNDEGEPLNDDEHPVRAISVERFAVSKYDITFADWRACVAGGGCRSNPEPDTDNRSSGLYPVINVNWTDAREYADWLSRMTGQNYRLLSEAEWEYAARAHLNVDAPYAEFPWGNEAPVCDAGAPNGAANQCSDKSGTRPVGGFRPNAFGLYDMIGNVGQWVEDCHHEYDPAIHDARAIDTGDCSFRVARGGGWQSDPTSLRAAARDSESPTFRNLSIGFRVARTITPQVMVVRTGDLDAESFAAASDCAGYHAYQQKFPTGAFISAINHLLATTPCQAPSTRDAAAAQSVTPLAAVAFHEPDMITLPGGRFIMGSPTTESMRQNDETQHAVTLSTFMVSKYEVTADDWEACVQGGGCGGYRPDTGDDDASDSAQANGRRPVTLVSWDDAQLYVAWLSHKTGKTYRLLSEAEWEYAARARTTSAYYWGARIGTGNANCIGCGIAFDGDATMPVGSFRPNSFGLYDMAGNVWEWVADCYSASVNISNNSPNTQGDCSQRVLRGGSYVDRPASLRAAARNWNAASTRAADIGFRVARTP
jgi:formylglycine-generating enzyme required for sulfatase activity